MMSKIGRNEPCPCGSGKKYKKCCGTTNIVSFNTDQYNLELDQLHRDLVDYTSNMHGNTLTKTLSKFYQPFIQEDSERNKIYVTGLTLWAILNVNCLDEDQTIFYDFYKKQKSKIKYSRTKQLFEEWSQRTPSVYEVLSKDPKSNTARLRDAITDEHFDVSSGTGNYLVEGNIAIGILVPYVQKYNFFANILEFNPDKKKEIIDLAKTYHQKFSNMKDCFPDFLGDVLTLEDNNQLVWNNPLHEKAAQSFAEQLQKKKVNQDFIHIGILLWNYYCQKKDPTFKKIGGYAGALEYLVQTAFLGNNVTQGNIAKAYETSAGTISSNYRKLMDVLEEEVHRVKANLDSNGNESLPHAQEN
ncbi:YecA family protein [Oceanobacillus halophilus]|uniref:SEC-C domain-containing protein n=1 Tax=Oceanobacillus halophilus TaxID=930130 RepID=A0A495A1V5_9BACI|nr:SEC-C metal-binding domain-containing protein [Oceanobacillus halophilus]RKQ33470.1 hypothetical protein D8M06_09680 [Oceanobacillus halophilus]